MKKIIAYFILFFVFHSAVVAQDVITLNTGQELKALIIRLNPGELLFVPENTTDTLSLAREDIKKLQYRSGIIIYLSDNESPDSSPLVTEPGQDSLFIAGVRDANLYYKGYKAASTGTLLCSLYFPFGLIPAIACSSNPPAISRLGYLDPKLMQNPQYYKGYTGQAYQIKKKKVWQGFAIGSGAVLGFYLVMSALLITSL
jgi:hypothetical protein